MLTVVTAMAILSVSFVAVPAGEVANRFEEQTIQYSGGDIQDQSFKYRVLKPAKIVEGETYPVVLFLHGAGERGDDNVAQLTYLPTWLSETELQEKYPCFLIVPQCPKGKWWRGEQLNVALKMLDKAIETYPIDTNRQYLTGLSMGGFGSWELAANHPDRFAAVVPICGGGPVEFAEKLTETPIWCFHGDADKVVSVDFSRKLIEAIKAAGGDPKYTELEGVAHDSWTPAYTKSDVLKWMFQQRKAAQN